ncbi:MAG TPA: hypothetical protein VNZ49_09340 [Bacteroidia bacterium]|jgi:hypothetical protein|nr:hypothetical protein [Bacteroidia bacterium]
MKTFLAIVVFLLFISSLKAQDTTLPQGNCKIYLISGKIIKNVRLWKINGNRAEYLRDNSLHDISTKEIDFIKYGRNDYAISDSAQLYKLEYDAIILKTGDTLFCFIKEISSDKIYFVQWGKVNVQYVFKSEIRKYLSEGKVDESQYSTTPIKTTEKFIDEDTTGRAGYEVLAQSKTDYVTLGKYNARNEFKGNGSFTGGMICGFIPIFGWATGVISLAVPPFVHPSNAKLYNSNTEYREAYQNEAHKKKTRKTLGGLLLGAAILVVGTIL